MDKGSRLRSVHRDDARIPKSPPRRGGNAGRNRQLLARVKEHLAGTINDKRRSPVEHEAERLPPGLLVPLQPGRKNGEGEGGGGRGGGESASAGGCVRCTDTSSRSGCLEMRIPRAPPASRLAFVDMQTMTRFPVPADFALPSRIPRRGEPGYSGAPIPPPPRIQRGPFLERCARPRSRPFFIAAGIYGAIVIASVRRR